MPLVWPMFVVDEELDEEDQHADEVYGYNTLNPTDFLNSVGAVDGEIDEHYSIEGWEFEYRADIHTWCIAKVGYSFAITVVSFDSSGSPVEFTLNGISWAIAPDWPLKTVQRVWTE